MKRRMERKGFLRYYKKDDELKGLEIFRATENLNPLKMSKRSIKKKSLEFL